MLQPLRAIAIALLITPALSASTHEFSGQIALGSWVNLKQKDATGEDVPPAAEFNDNVALWRARLCAKGPIISDWQYELLVQTPERENSQIGLDPLVTTASDGVPFMPQSPLAPLVAAQVAHAAAHWHGLPGMTVSIGLIEVPEVSATHLGYQALPGKYPGNQLVGSVIYPSGNHPGIAVAAEKKRLGIALALWEQTDVRAANVAAQDLTMTTSGSSWAGMSQLLSESASSAFFEASALRLAAGGRISYATALPYQWKVGGGVGFQSAPLNMPIIAAVVAELSSGGSSAPHAVAVTSFNRLNNLAVSAIATRRALQFQASYEYQSTPAANSSVSFGGSTSQSSESWDIFNQKGSASALALQAGYLLYGERYIFDKQHAAISRVKLMPGLAGLEVVARYGHERRSNILALLTPNGWDDFRTYDDLSTAYADLAEAGVIAVAGVPSDRALLVKVDNTGVTPSISQLTGGSASNVFEEKVSGLTLGFNYYVSDNAVLQIEYTGEHHEFKRGGSQWVPSIFNKTTGVLHCRIEYSFA